MHIPVLMPWHIQQRRTLAFSILPGNLAAFGLMHLTYCTEVRPIVSLWGGAGRAATATATATAAAGKLSQLAGVQEQRTQSVGMKHDSVWSTPTHDINGTHTKPSQASTSESTRDGEAKRRNRRNGTKQRKTNAEPRHYATTVCAAVRGVPPAEPAPYLHPRDPFPQNSSIPPRLPPPKAMRGPCLQQATTRRVHTHSTVHRSKEKKKRKD